MKFGVSVHVGDAFKSIVEDIVKDGEVDWNDTTVDEVIWDNLDNAIKRNSKRIWQSNTVVFRPKIFFPLNAFGTFSKVQRRMEMLNFIKFKPFKNFVHRETGVSQLG